MEKTDVELTAEDEAKVEEFAGSLFMAGLAAMELANVELGIRLGLYEAMAGAGAMTSAELAARAGIHERYAREWLEQQAVAGVVEVEDAAAGAGDRRFTLPNAHAHVLMDDDSESCMKPCAGIIPWAGKAIDIMAEEFRSGTGVTLRSVRPPRPPGSVHASVFVNHLVQSWLPAMGDVHERLVRGEPVRIAEVGCGEGFAAITIAKAFPSVTIDGFDLDDASIAAASAGASAAGVSDRVRFHARDAGDPAIAGDYDLVLAIEMLHDVPDPVSVLRTMARLAGEHGMVVVATNAPRRSSRLLAARWSASCTRSARCTASR